MEFRENHILPTVRIQKIKMTNFKSVHHGEVIFNCGRKFVPQDTEADILGIYGQNGSGKTAVIEALAVLKYVMSGFAVPKRYTECIAEDADFSELAFVFDLQYKNDNISYIRTVTYTFKISAVPSEINEDESNMQNNMSQIYPNKIKVFDEKISASGMFGGKEQQKQNILTTSLGKCPIGPKRKISEYVGKDKDEVIIDLKVNQKTASMKSWSFIFMKDTLELFYQRSDYSEYFQVLFELSYFARYYLYAIDTRSSGMGAESVIPFNTRWGLLPLNLKRGTIVSQHIFDEIKEAITQMNIVLPTIIANMEIVLKYDDYVSGEEKGLEIKLFSKRNNAIIPLRDESAGIIKLVSVLALIIAAFNDRSITVAIDELDAGIYEYLLGEILLALETYGKGQFIFTSHNLRPLEVLKKEDIIFTTSNPDNRYIRLKGVGRTNNLRDLYLREILGNTQDEQIYDAAKRQRMIAAFLKAGDGK